MPSLKPGSRFTSSVCTTQVIVVKGAGEVDLRCGGAPMLAAGAAADGGLPVEGASGGTRTRRSRCSARSRGTDPWASATPCST